MPAPVPPPGRVLEVARLFGWLGAVAFGGPVAHTAMMHRELVGRRRWLDDRRFLDLVGATNLVPGPNSTELAIHLGHERAGWRGLLTAGVCFILPGALLVTGLAWVYVEHGDTPAVEGLFYGVVPVVIAVIAHALAGLTRSVLDRPWRVAVVAAAFAAYVAGVHELAVLAAGAALPVLASAVWTRTGRSGPGAGGRHGLLLPALAAAAGDADLGRLFLGMLKIGAVLYGSGYVLLTFLDGEFVDRLGWLTTTQLDDAVAAGQVTPGPVFTTATFVGYLVAGPAGAFVATVGIFLPSFVFVGLLTRITGALRRSRWTSLALDGVTAASFALMAGVLVTLGRTAVVDPLTAGLALVSLLLLWRTSWNSTWFIAAGALVGLAHTLLPHV